MVTHPATNRVSHKRVLAVVSWLVTAVFGFFDIFGKSVDHVYLYGMFSLALGQSGYTIFEDKLFKKQKDTEENGDV